MNASPWSIYELLEDAAADNARIHEVLIGLTWTLCETDRGFGLAMSPTRGTRTLPWPGTLAGRSVGALSPWIRSWNPHEACVGMAAINAVINPTSQLAARAMPIHVQGSANLAVFEHFAPRLAGRRVVVVGRYPGLDSLQLDWHLTVLECQPGPEDLPAQAAEFVLAEADWVFLTATSLINKTFPRLVACAREATLVLMGPTLPWLGELADWGVDYLAGVRVVDSTSLRKTVGEGGGTRIFETGVDYAVASLGQNGNHIPER
ncbi:hypothetical protein CKO35_10195 [Ectothiorhodospira shaposhnikovii]|uniref:DUF364 domain-containing protein n=1 Tax=Ectothiorhodospira shaposhnikovii TaxID=1054 RepID=UPI00190811F4|nr:DUF364 domain-containing protein [Ectothiorhodospira shaposhnikovii]MBK1673671.1 hypothetical protein [Ectothiorhodospira shaposhnikovii]